MKIARFEQYANRHVRKPLNRRISVIVLSAAMAIVVACGGSSDGSGSGNVFEQVVPSETIYSLSNLEAINYKVSKTYDVDGLTNADAAYYGFWRDSPNSNPTDYEVRVYGSHAAAVESGTAQAEEATGDDAVLDRSIATWTEGLSDRRRVVGPGASQGSGQPRYPDYMILGNLVILCEGLNLEDAQDNCGEIVSALQTSSS